MPALLPLTDRCYLGTQSATAGYGEPRGTYSYSETETRCAVINPVSAEDSAGMQLPMGTMRIAFRRDAGVTAATRVQVIRRLRQTLAEAEFYTVMGEPRNVRGRLIAECSRTTGRSAK